MQFKDYYRILGVAHDAAESELKRSYRKLARKYHPDVSREADTEQRMQEVNEAYEVLEDPEKRAAYDELSKVMAQGKVGVRKGIAEALAKLSDRLPAMVIDTLREQWARIVKMDEEIASIERRLKLWLKQSEACWRIAEIPGVGPLTATAAVAIMGDAKAFKSGREFAAFAGLVTRQTGTGGRIKLLGISKRGDTYLRTLLIHGARAVLTKAKDAEDWANKLRQRRVLNVAIVALANKMAHTIWAILTRPWAPFRRSPIKPPALPGVFDSLTRSRSLLLEPKHLP